MTPAGFVCKHLEKMTPEKWNGKSRKMLVWLLDDEVASRIELIIGYDDRGLWVTSDGDHWTCAADIPKPRLMTKKELAEWLQDGNGCFRYGKKGSQQWDKTYYIFHPTVDEENDPVLDSCRIRVRGTNDWVKPTIDIIGLSDYEDCGIKRRI